MRVMLRDCEKAEALGGMERRVGPRIVDLRVWAQAKCGEGVVRRRVMIRD